MALQTLMKSVLLAGCVSLLAACATQAADTPAAPATATAPAATASAAPATAAAPTATATEASPEAKTEADAATLAEKKFQEAARSYRMVQKDGKTMYCKKEKPINSTIPRMECISEAQLRLQVEQMDELRERMRNSGRCTRGPGCSSGG
jgi:hypothetical protein